MAVTKDEALKLLEVLLNSGGGWDDWMRDLSEAFPEHPWWEYVAALAESDHPDLHWWRAILEDKPS